ncbi:TPA: hypothetical protein ACH3X3_014243 [Trebouxia sp. C0006]
MARKRKFFHAAGQSGKRSQVEAAEIEQLEQILESGKPAPKTDVLAQSNESKSGTYVGAKKFDELPISQNTKDGLAQSQFTQLTAIQRASLPHALCGRDILGAAKTGSGKTLAFLIPVSHPTESKVLEKLYRLKWGPLDGLGSLIISPTRELALQIFDELRKIGKKHDFSAGLLIGGKKVKEEQERVHGMNMLVCTPGRLLQHMDETPGFDASQIQILVLDEADRILDMGFSATLNAILQNLPQERQTMLFSATQTKSVKDLARLSLKAPEYIAVHAEAAMPTPVKLQQAYVICELHEKVNVLWSFIKTHLRSKVIVFLSTCKQVKFMYEAFKKLRPGVPLRSLHGKMKQFKRMAVFYDFCEAKTGSVLFATDIAARGLDFPTVDWVVQADCPEDVPSYIHRVGRTARYIAEGRALLLLLPSEQEAMLKALEVAKVPVKVIKMNPHKQQPITGALQALLSKDSALKELGQRALVAYLRSVFLQPNHAIFDVQKLPAAEYALSIGLPTAPKLRFLKHAGKHVKEINIGGGHQLETRASEPEAAVPKIAAAAAAAAAAADSPVDMQSASSADDSEPELQELPKQSSPNKRRRITDLQPDNSKHDDSEVDTDPDSQGAPSPVVLQGTAHAQRPGDRHGSGNVSSDDDDDVDEDDDDLLVVKRRDVLSDSNAAAAAEGGIPLGGVELRGNKKRKKLRIDPGKTSGARTVFDEAGESLQPLALLAKEELDRGEVSDAMMAALGLDVGANLTAEERFKQVAAVMKRRDAQDRKEQRDLRRQQKLDKKLKQKARESGEADMGVTLASAVGSDEEESSDQEREEEDAVRHEQENDSDNDGIAYEGGLTSSDEEDEQNQPKQASVAGKAAYFGMQKKSNAASATQYEGLSLAEQEALALRMIKK